MYWKLEKWQWSTYENIDNKYNTFNTIISTINSVTLEAKLF